MDWHAGAAQSVLKLNQHALRWTFGFGLAKAWRTAIFGTKIWDSRKVRNSIDGNAEAAPSGRRACVGVCAFFVVGVACTEQVFWAPVRVQVCTLWQVSVDTSVHICENAFPRVCTCARVYTICSLALGGESGGFQLIYAGHLFLAKSVILDMRTDRGVAYVFFISWWGFKCMWVYVGVYAHPHKLHVGYLDVGPGVGTRHLVSRKNPDRLKLYIHVNRTRNTGKWRKCDTFFRSMTPWLATWAGHDLLTSEDKQL